LIVDDHPMTRAGLAHMINHQPDMIVSGEAESAAQALAALEASEPDLMLVDITLPGKSGLELIKDLKAMHPGLPVLVISMHDESLYADRVLRAGARGYITKHEGGEKLMRFPHLGRFAPGLCECLFIPIRLRSGFGFGQLQKA